MKTWMSVLGMLLVSGVGWQAAAQSAGAGAAKLVGTWRLVSSTLRMADGTARADPQTGARGAGYLIYTEAGRVCAMTANPDRPRWKPGTPPTEAELRAAFDGLVAYCGTYEVNEAERFVIHHIEIDRLPGAAGSERKRYFALSGKRLTLRPAPPLPAGVQEWTIEWERVAGNEKQPTERER